MELKNDGLTRERDGAKCVGGNGVVTSRHTSPLLTTETVVIKRSGIQPFGFVVVYLFELIRGDSRHRRMPGSSEEARSGDHSRPVCVGSSKVAIIPSDAPNLAFMAASLFSCGVCHINCYL